MDAPTPISQSKHDRYIIAHAVLGSVATLIILPIAVLFGRYGRNWRHWNTVHTVLQFFTLAFIVITFALGNAALKDPNQYTGAHTDVHHQLGLAATVILIVQFFLGVGVRLIKSPPHNYVTIQRRRPVLRYVHIILGIGTAAVLYAQIYTGFAEWNNTSDSMTIVPKGIYIGYWVLFGLAVAAYILGWPIMEYLGRKKRARVESDEKPMMAEPRTSQASTGRLLA